MNKISLNKLINKGSKIFYTKGKYNHYVSIDGHFIIRFNKFDQLTKASERHIKNRTDESKDLKTLYKDFKNDLTEPLRYTEFIKDDDIQKLGIFRVNNRLKYINYKYIELLNDSIINYMTHTKDTDTTPMIFEHKAEPIAFIFLPFYRTAELDIHRLKT